MKSAPPGTSLADQGPFFYFKAPRFSFTDSSAALDNTITFFRVSTLKKANGSIRGPRPPSCCMEREVAFEVWHRFPGKRAKLDSRWAVLRSTLVISSRRQQTPRAGVVTNQNPQLICQVLALAASGEGTKLHFVCQETPPWSNRRERRHILAKPFYGFLLFPSKSLFLPLNHESGTEHWAGQGSLKKGKTSHLLSVQQSPESPGACVVAFSQRKLANDWRPFNPDPVHQKTYAAYHEFGLIFWTPRKKSNKLIKQTG